MVRQQIPYGPAVTMRVLLLSTLVLAPCALLAAQDDLPLEIRLVSEAKTISPGQTFHLGLHLVHPPGTHTYWKNPGIVGLATTLKWTLPPGFTAGEIQWPAPEIVKMAGHSAQGYEGETLLLIPVTPPGALAVSSVTFTAKASWMYCGKTCQPTSDAPFSVTLAVGASPETNPATSPLFEKIRSNVPHADPRWKASVTHQQEKILLTLMPPPDLLPFPGPDGIHFFTSDGQVDSDQKQEITLSSGGEIQLALPVSEIAAKTSATLPGVLRFQAGAIEINPAFQ